MIKKYILIFLTLIITVQLSSCSIETRFDESVYAIRNYASTSVITSKMLRSLKFQVTNHDQVLEILGEPSSYYVDGVVYYGQDLPRKYLMIYDGEVDIEIDDELVTEVRIYRKDITYDDTYYVGMDKELAMSLVSSPDLTSEGRGLYYQNFVLYTNITMNDYFRAYKPKVEGYYSDPVYGIRLWFDENSVTALCYYKMDEQKYLTE